MATLGVIFSLTAFPIHQQFFSNECKFLKANLKNGLLDILLIPKLD